MENDDIYTLTLEVQEFVSFNNERIADEADLEASRGADEPAARDDEERGDDEAGNEEACVPELTDSFAFGQIPEDRQAAAAQLLADDPCAVLEEFSVLVNGGHMAWLDRMTAGAQDGSVTLEEIDLVYTLLHVTESITDPAARLAAAEDLLGIG